MAFTLPPLPYDYTALEPHIDEQTMRIHHDKHHAAYVNNLNAALEPHPDLQKKTVEELIANIDALPEAIRTPVRNNGGGHVNHTMFWEMMAPGGAKEPSGPLADAITKAFGGLAQFKEQFQKACVGPVRQRLGLAGGRPERRAHHREHAEPGHSAHERQAADPRLRRLGARLLPQVSEPPSRLRGRVVERRQLERHRPPVRPREGSLSFMASLPAVGSPAPDFTLASTGAERRDALEAAGEERAARVLPAGVHQDVHRGAVRLLRRLRAVPERQHGGAADQRRLGGHAQGVQEQGADGGGPAERLQARGQPALRYAARGQVLSRTGPTC